MDKKLILRSNEVNRSSLEILPQKIKFTLLKIWGFFQSLHELQKRLKRIQVLEVYLYENNI